MYSFSHDIFQTTQNYKKSDRFVREYGGRVGQELLDIMQHIRRDRQRLLHNKRKSIRSFLLISTGALLVVILTY